MATYTRTIENGKIFVGIDIHKRTWYVTIITGDGEELFSRGIPANWDNLKKLLNRYKRDTVRVVYEAGYFGYWLHDLLIEHGCHCIVTPPSLIPQEYGNRVKTDRRDSRKLALLLAKSMLKRVYVPTKKERYHRQVLRRRRQLIGDRIRTQNRIKSELMFYGIPLPQIRGNWSKTFMRYIWGIHFKDPWMQESYHQLLELYGYLSNQIDKQTALLKELSQTDRYRDRVQILTSIPGIGLIGAMELLLELQDVARFKRADQLAAYVGLTPSQYSSADKIRMGHITRIGKNQLRALLIESSWHLIRKDENIRIKYEQILLRSGSKRAIVAIARRLLLCSRRMLLDGKPYSTSSAA